MGAKIISFDEEARRALERGMVIVTALSGANVPDAVFVIQWSFTAMFAAG